jgi:hypothetical protein
MLRSNVVPPAKYPEALAGPAVQQSLVAQTPTLGLADGQSVAKLLEATLLQPVGLLKALEAFPIAPAISGFRHRGTLPGLRTCLLGQSFRQALIAEEQSSREPVSQITKPDSPYHYKKRPQKAGS